MHFNRYPRYEYRSMSERMVSAFLRKQAKERARYPLFSDHVASEQHGLDVEMVKRISVQMTSEQQMRNYRAQSWRKGRAGYFAQPAEVRAEIRTQWQKWVGPREPSYFYWMVDVHSGEQARRLAACEAQTAKIREKVFRDLAAQNTMSLA